MELRIVLLLVHITAAAFLFGGSAGMARPVRRSLSLGQKAILSAAEDLLRRGQMVGSSGLVTLLSGVVLLATRTEGFGASPKNFHAALGLMLVSVLVSAFVLRPTGQAILAEAQKEVPHSERIGALLKRLGAGQGILHLLWVVLLVLMFVRF